ncbi:hypothetical protein M408DRAFT_329702 [Serendipita vermifera MAFF 305830]|uniref:Uncharacterized protein n=1 Tax=Serendipita vermifera MAFF 305830 TaxID=933852 RepID=A0A0C2XG43_SERVB|nr:hypothetical protein M408DRAFT_329702 [Serendipita vermifera MAFF 305830]
MPGAPASTTAETPQLYDPVDTFVLRTQGGEPSILDTVFVSKKSQRAVYATTTHGPHTSLWRVAASGTMTEIARVDWEHEIQAALAGDGSLRNSNKPGKKCSMLTFGGKMRRTEDFLQRARGWFSSDSRSFSVDNVELKWKSGTENGTEAQQARNSTSAYQEVWKIWRCVSSRPPSGPNPPNPPSINHASPFPILQNPFPPTPFSAHATAQAPAPVSSPLPEQHQSTSAAIRSIITSIVNTPAPSTVLARFAPPQIGLQYNLISFFPPAFSETEGNPQPLETLLVSTILLAVRKGEWKHIQSSNTTAALQAVFLAEAAGEIPPYTPGGNRNATSRNNNTVRTRTQSERSRRIPEVASITGDRPPPSRGGQGESERAPLLPRRHQSTRSSPFNVFPTLPFNLGTITGRSPATATERTRSRTVSARRPATAGSAPAGDGVFAGRRPSMQLLGSSTSAPASAQGHGRTGDTAGISSIRGPPPAYK